MFIVTNQTLAQVSSLALELLSWMPKQEVEALLQVDQSQSSTATLEHLLEQLQNQNPQLMLETRRKLINILIDEQTTDNELSRNDYFAVDQYGVCVGTYPTLDVACNAVGDLVYLFNEVSVVHRNNLDTKLYTVKQD